MQKNDMKKIVLSLAALLLVGGGCAAKDTSESGAVGVRVGDMAPAFDVQTVDGSFSLEQKMGGVVVMTSMASWCPTCMVEAKQLALAASQLPSDGVSFLSISIDPTDDAAKINVFREDQNTPWDYAGLFSDEAVQRLIIDYKMTQREKTYVIGPDGIIVYTDGGISVADKIVDAVNSAL